MSKGSWAKAHAPNTSARSALSADLDALNVPHAVTDLATGAVKNHWPARPLVPSGVGKSRIDGILTKHGRVLDKLTDPTQTIGTTTATHSLSNERPRFGAYTRKMTVTSSGGSQSELRFVNRVINPDASDRAFSIDIYVEQIPDSNITAPDNPRLSFVISNGSGSPGSNYIQYVFDHTGIRQGWNTFKFRAADVQNTKLVGNMAYGSYVSATGSGVDWNSAIGYVSVQASDWDGGVFHIDDVRQPARAKPVFILGWDANMEIMESHVAPMLALYGIKAYTTFTKVYEEESAQQGGDDGAWARMKRLQDEWGWDIINHSWSHGGTEVGANHAVTLSRTSNVVTVTKSTDHGVPLKVMFKAKITGATTADLNGFFDIYADTATTYKYTATGANVGSEAAVIRTFLADVLRDDTAENRRLLEREILGNTQLMCASGANRQNGAIIWPNNSVPNIDMVEDLCHEAGIYVGRGARFGFTPVNEFGIVNPLHCGSWDMDSGATSYQRLSFMKLMVQAAIDRGEHIWIYGHYLQLQAEAGGAVVDPDAPPGINGNPLPPAGALSGYGGWWYYEMLEDLIRTTVAPKLASGEMLCMTPSELARYMSLAD